jgi:hypothetical protein
VYVVPRVDFALYKGRSKAAMHFSVQPKPTEQQQLGCVRVCCAQPLSSTSSQPLRGVWNSPGRSIGAAGQLQLPTAPL